MATEPTNTWRPDWAVTPGEILLEALQDRGMTQSELARRLDRPLKTVNEIIRGRAAITPDTAIQLERALGISASLWNNLETRFREHLAQERAQDDLAANASWIDSFPVSDLVRYGLVQGRGKIERLAGLLSFFGVSSPTAWDRLWTTAPSASFRSSPAFAASPHAVAAWLRWGEIEASRHVSRPYDESRFRAVVAEARLMTNREPFMSVVERLQELFAEAGVVLVLTPELKGTHLSGAARWPTTERALIQLSLRFQTDDQFWFTLFHEAGHVLESHGGRDFIDVSTDDDDSDAEEALANEFARNLLIPAADYERFVAGRVFNTEAIRAFAQKQRLAPGIVLGRLQRDRHVLRSSLNFLKKSRRWSI